MHRHSPADCPQLYRGSRWSVLRTGGAPCFIWPVIQHAMLGTDALDQSNRDNSIWRCGRIMDITSGEGHWHKQSLWQRATHAAGDLSSGITKAAPAAIARSDWWTSIRHFAILPD
jgi:hypothetical protein